MAGLLALPDDVLSSLIAQSLLAKHLPSAIRLSATSKHIRYSCKPLVAEAEKNAPDNFLLINVASAVIGVPVYSYYRDSKRVQEKIVRASSRAVARSR